MQRVPERRGSRRLAHLRAAGAGSPATRLFPGWPQGGGGEPGLAFGPSGPFLCGEEHWAGSRGLGARPPWASGLLATVVGKPFSPSVPQLTPKRA